MLHFDNDYMRGAHPDILRRLSETNYEQSPGYGMDDYCAKARDLILRECGMDGCGEVYFMTGGTQTNATVIDALLARHEGVLAASTSHVNVHEAGAIEASGHKVIVLDSPDGKLHAGAVARYLRDFYADDTFEHMVAPGMVYISHPTELGTLYTLDELNDLARVCGDAGIPLYLDGARLGYGLAASGTDVTLEDIARLCDVFYIGGTKVGALFGEAVVVRQRGLLPHFFSIIKQHGALLAKGRLLGLQFSTLFTDRLYMRISEHAVRMSIKLKQGFLAKGYSMYIDSPTNQQFFILPNSEIDRLGGVATFSLWGPRGDCETPVRFVTDWSTQESDVDALLDYLSSRL